MDTVTHDAKGKPIPMSPKGGVQTVHTDKGSPAPAFIEPEAVAAADAAKADVEGLAVYADVEPDVAQAEAEEAEIEAAEPEPKPRRRRSAKKEA